MIMNFMIFPIAMLVILAPIRKAVVEQILHLVLPRLMIETLVPHYVDPLAIFFVRKEAVIQRSLKRLAIEALANKHKLLAAIAPLPAVGDIELHHLVHFLVAREVLLRGQGAKPGPAAPHGDHGTGLGPLSGTMRASGKEEFPLGPEEASEERTSPLVGEDDVVGGHVEGIDVFLHVDVLCVIRVILPVPIAILGHLLVFIPLAIVMFIFVRNLELHDELVTEQLEQATGVKRSRARVDEVADIVLLGFGLGSDDTLAVDLLTREHGLVAG
jgi:hypothetical protein